jgi:hypothetical protein
MNPVVEKMENIHTLLDQIKTDIPNGKSVEEVFQTLVPLLEKDPQTGGRLAELLVAIPDKMIGSLLHRMFEVTQDKKVRKTIKRSLYRMKGKGVVVEEVFPNKKESILRPLKVEPPKGFGNGYDFSWNRFLIITIPHPGRGSMLVHGLVNDMKGLVDFSGEEMSRKALRNFFDEVEKVSPTPVVEMEASYVAFLFTQAYQLTLAQGGTSPPDYLHLKSEVEKIRKDYERPLIYSCMNENEIEGDEWILRRAGDLLKKDFFYGWMIEEQEIRPFADEVWQAEESKLILNQAQKEARFQEIYQRALSTLFPEEKRSLYQRRMEEMAYLLFKLGREEEARISLAVALDLKKPPNLLLPNPFLLQLVIKSIFTLLAEAYERKSKELSLIVKP